MNRFLKKIVTLGILGTIVFSTSMSVVSAKNRRLDTITWSFYDALGDYCNTTDGRAKDDNSCGYINGIWADDNLPFEAYMVAAAGNDGNAQYEYFDDFHLYKYRVNPGNTKPLMNLIIESGYRYAALRGEALSAGAYTVQFAWSPDSLVE